MPRNPFQRLVSLKGPASAVTKLTRASTCEAAPEHSKMPQSQPMQRSTESQISDSESEGTLSPSSDEELILGSTSSTTWSSSSPLPTHIPPEGLHSPLRSNDPALLRVAEILTESIVTLDDGWCFTPSPDEQYLLNYDYTEEQGTVLAVHALVKRASLPVDTFILAALILRRLKPEFYDEWCELMSNFQPVTSYDDERTREVVILAAIVIAQKFLHDAIYTLTTWSDMVCEARSDLHNDNIHATERLILAHISWRVSMIADEETISAWVANAHEEAAAAQQRYSKILPNYTSDFEDMDDGEYSHGSPNGY